MSKFVTKLNQKQREHIKETYFYSRLLNVVSRDKSIDSTAKVIYSDIFTMVYQGNKFFKGNKFLAQRSGISVPTVIHALKELKANGYIDYKFISGVSHNKKHTKYIKKRCFNGINLNKLSKLKAQQDKQDRESNHYHIISNKATLNTFADMFMRAYPNTKYTKQLILSYLAKKQKSSKHPINANKLVKELQNTINNYIKTGRTHKYPLEYIYQLASTDKSFVPSKPIIKPTTHTYPASPLKSASHKLTTAQLNTLKADAKLATKLFPKHYKVVRPALSGLLKRCIPDKYGHTIGNINNIRKALIIVKHDKYKNVRTITSPVAYACGISKESNNVLLSQYKEAKSKSKKSNERSIKDKINKKLGSRYFLIKGKGKSKKIYVNTNIKDMYFDNKIKALRHDNNYSNKTLDNVMDKYNKENNEEFNYGDDF